MHDRAAERERARLEIVRDRVEIAPQHAQHEVCGRGAVELVGRHDLALEDVAQQVADRRRVQRGAERPRVQKEPRVALVDREQLEEQGRRREEKRDHERQLGAPDGGDRRDHDQKVAGVEQDPSARRRLEQQHRHDRAPARRRRGRSSAGRTPAREPCAPGRSPCPPPPKTRRILERAERSRAAAGRGSGNEKGPRERALLLGIGGVEGDRTLDLGIANAALSQLSYHPTEEAGFYLRP